MRVATSKSEDREVFLTEFGTRVIGRVYSLSTGEATFRHVWQCETVAEAHEKFDLGVKALDLHMVR